MFVDSHCHLTYEPLKNNIAKIIEKCDNAKVTNLLTIGTSIKSSLKCSEISKKYKNIYSSVGIHPCEAHVELDRDFEIKDLYKSSNKNIGYGETGLDFFYSKDNKKRQIDLFETHIQYAKEDNSTVIVHTRDSDDETLSIIKNNANTENVKFLIHCFTGTLSFAKSLLDMGCYISFSGIITFKNTLPYLSPHPLRGKANSPENVVYVAKKIAELKQINLEEVGAKTSKNFFKVFNIK
jgi:TatD DNase family protein